MKPRSMAPSDWRSYQYRNCKDYCSLQAAPQAYFQSRRPTDTRASRPTLGQILLTANRILPHGCTAKRQDCRGIEGVSLFQSSIIVTGNARAIIRVCRAPIDVIRDIAI